MKKKTEKASKIAKEEKKEKVYRGVKSIKKVDWNKAEYYFKCGATGEQVASKMGMSYDTLRRRFKTEIRNEMYATFAQYIDSKKDSGKLDLIVSQHESALSGNTTMQIWLGKNNLDQSDKKEVDHKGLAINFTVDRASNKDESDQ